jgi:hypothetical protein
MVQKVYGHALIPYPLFTAHKSVRSSASFAFYSPPPPFMPDLGFDVPIFVGNNNGNSVEALALRTGETGSVQLMYWPHSHPTV